MTIINIIRKIGESLGLYITRYRPKYHYVPRDLVRQKFHDGVQRGGQNHLLDIQQFFLLADRVVLDQKTMLGYDRLYILWQSVRNIARLSGAMAEIGSFRGGSAYFLADAYRTLMKKDASFHVIDTFEGHPEKINPENDPYHVVGKFSNTDYKTVKNYLKDFPELEVHKGEFSNVVRQLADSKYFLVHIDVDIYQTTLDCLNYYAPRMVLGGVVILDDFDAVKCPGVNKAAEEFLETTSLFQIWQPFTEQLVMTRVK